MKYKLRASVSVVDLGNDCLEFFKTNTRKSIKIKCQNDLIRKLVIRFDGRAELSELAQELGFDENAEETKKLIQYLKEKAVLANDALVRERPDYPKYRRVIHFLEDYSSSNEDLLEMWSNIRNARVMIIGLGAVGTWVAANLVQSGIQNLILVDNDIVEISNLHRQYGYKVSDVGKKKTTVLKERLKEIEKNVNISEYNVFLEENTLDNTINEKLDLIINCADKPTVDLTSKWVGKYCMKRGIPHIVGGGYNMHLSLVGQTIIPGKTACVHCFEEQLKQMNELKGADIRRLNIKNRKIGSFGPMCTIIASMTGMEAIKVLSKKIPVDNANRRGEFDIYNMSLKYTTFKKLDDCDWCRGKYDERNKGDKCPTK